MTTRLSRVSMLALLALPFLSFSAMAQLAVSANDNKAVLVDGVNTVPQNPPADTVTIIDLGASPARIVAEIEAPTSVVGPPSSVAVAPDESIALVTSATRIDPADPKKVVPNNKVSVIDLKASPPAVVATVEAGAGSAGIAINGAGNLVLVANRSEGTVSVFTLTGKQLTSVGKVALGDAKSGPSAVAFSPDGKTALVTRDGDHKISVLSIDGSKVEYAKRDIHAGLRPYPLDITRAGTSLSSPTSGSAVVMPIP
jgi:DNA-binding beta-propeller fold protein YncE